MVRRLIERIRDTILQGEYDLTRHADEMAENVMYGYKCEHCEGIVQERIVKREAFKHRNGFVARTN